MATSTENSGILFIYESDGFQWATHIASLLENEPYNIPCATEHWWNLTLSTASFHPVHVLLLSPLMEGNIKHEKFSHLRNESETSLLLECNVDSKDLQMLEWKVIETLDTTLEKQRNILTTLVEMYELETNDNGSFSPDEFLCIDIVPTCLYPGERTIHIMFSIEPQGEVTVRLEGMPKRLPTRKHTKNTYTCEFPETGPGQKITSVYVEGTGYSLYTTKIVIVTADALMENFLENLKHTLGIRIRSHSSRTWHTMGLFFNPFCEYLCPQGSQVYFAERIAEVIAQNKKTQRDSGFSAASDEHFYEMIPYALSDSLQSLPTHQKVVATKSQPIKSFFKKLFRTGNQDYALNHNVKRKKLSRRAMMTRSQRVHTVPELPSSRRNNVYDKRFISDRK